MHRQIMVYEAMLGRMIWCFCCFLF